MKKWIFLGLLLAVAGLIGWQVWARFDAKKTEAGAGGSLQQGRQGGGMGGQAVAVEVAAVSKAPIRDVREFPGTLLPQSQFTVAPRVGGRLKRLYCDVGERVRNGQPVAEIDDTDYRIAVEQAAAEVAVASANEDEARSALDQAARELERVRSLQEKKIASASELDAAQSNVEAREARLKVAKAQVTRASTALEAARIRLADTKIAAMWPEEQPPGNGSQGAGEDFRVVGERFVDEGALLLPNAPIITLLDLRTVKAVLHATERDVALVREGQEALLEVDAYRGRSFPGRIARISPVLKETTRKLRAEVEAKNPDLALKAGMFLRILIEVERRDDATVIPSSALVKRDGATGVFLADIESRTVKFVEVVTGLHDEKSIEIIEPALAGFVVTIGQHLLKDGSSIILPQDRAGAPSGKGESGGKRPGGADRKGPGGSKKPQ